MENNNKLQTPYVSFVTFKALLERLSETGVPARFDASYWPSNYSGAQISHLKKALLFFGFIDESDSTQQPLRELINLVSEKERKEKFKEILWEKCSNYLQDINFETGTRKQLEDKFEGAGQMKSKRIAFFINAAQYCGMTLSTFMLVPQKRQRISSSRKKPPKNDNNNKEKDKLQKPPIPPQTQESLLRIGINGEPYSSLKFDALKKLTKEEIEYLAGWLEDQSSSLRRYLKLQKAEE